MAEPYTREDWADAPLNLKDLDPDPIKQFGRWFGLVLSAAAGEPTAMTLATATREGVPSARTVLLKDFDGNGFTFFTNYGSRKARELLDNPRAVLVFHWPAFHRQVLVSGSVERVASEESDAYFKSRPRGSQLGAWASKQSEVIAGREALDARVAELERRYERVEVPRPSFWGGFRVAPNAVEFWQGRVSRLHDRFRYRRDGEKWVIERLAP